MDFSHWYEKVYPSLSGYGLWLRGNEPNTIPASAFATRPFRVLITRLSTYRDTADSFTHKLLYQIVGRIDGAYPDLCWLPPPKDASIFCRDNTPWLLGATSKHEGRDFNVVALSLSIVQELLNILPMLRTSGIPLAKRERMADPSCPLVLLGGASALYTSALRDDDPPVDGVFVGTDARVIRQLFERCRNGYARGLGKAAVLDSLQSIPGFFTLDGARTTAVFQAPELPGDQLLEEGPVLYNEDSIGTASLQISEGCACSCSFCAESFSRKPYREYPAELLLAAALRLKAGMAVEDIELYSFNFSMHRDFYRIITGLAPIFPSIGLKSQRLDAIAADPALLPFLHAIGKTSITCGFEGISPRLRRYLNKSLGEKTIRDGFAALLALPLREIKIFLIATGHEEKADYDAFHRFLTFLRETMQHAGRQPRIIFSMTVLVRFPWTPLEFEDAPDEAVCSAVLRAVDRLVSAAGFEFRASADSADYWLSQLLVRADDPRIWQAVAAAVATSNFAYYEGVPVALIECIKNKLEISGASVKNLFAGRSPTGRRIRPWVRIETGVAESLLIRQWETAHRVLATQAEESAAGLDIAGITIKASHRPASRNTLPAERLRELIAACRSREVALPFRITVGASLAGAPAAMRGVILCRGLLRTEPKLAPGYRGYKGSLASRRFGSNWVRGEDVISLAWDRETIAGLQKLLADQAFVENVNQTMNGAVTLVGLAAPDRETAPAVLTFRSPYSFDPASYCQDRSLRFTLCKIGPSAWGYQFAKETLKKKLLLGCTLE